MSEETQKILLRPFTEEDLPAMVSWNNDPEIEYLVDRCLPKTLGKCLAWFKKHSGERNYRLYALENEEGRLIGEVELDHICWKRREAELRIRIGGKPYWDRGYGALALREILEKAFFDFRLDSVYLRVYTFNRRAVHCYEKVGFRKEAFLRRRLDKDWKEILLMRIDKDRFLKSRFNKQAFRKRGKTDGKEDQGFTGG